MFCPNCRNMNKILTWDWKTQPAGDEPFGSRGAPSTRFGGCDRINGGINYHLQRKKRFRPSSAANRAASPNLSDFLCYQSRKRQWAEQNFTACCSSDRRDDEGDGNEEDREDDGDDRDDEDEEDNKAEVFTSKSSLSSPCSLSSQLVGGSCYRIVKFCSEW